MIACSIIGILLPNTDVALEYEAKSSIEVLHV
jgi:hypothetical protein